MMSSGRTRLNGELVKSDIGVVQVRAVAGLIELVQDVSSAYWPSSLLNLTLYPVTAEPLSDEVAGQVVMIFVPEFAVAAGPS
jgi:hypothetical protein